MSDAQKKSRQPQLGTYVTMIVGLLFLFLLISQAGKYHSSGYIMGKAEERLKMREDREKTMMLIGAEPQRPAGEVAQRDFPQRQIPANNVVNRPEPPQNSFSRFVDNLNHPQPDRNVRHWSLQPPTVQNREYRVRSNDTLYNIASKVYGNGNRWRDIVKANPDLNDPSKLRPGMKLTLPTPENPAAAAAFDRWSRSNTM